MSESPRIQFATSETSPEIDKEERLLLIQQEAMALVPTDKPLVPIASSERGYYELPMVKAPAWSWEIPVYFFVGGAAGAAGVIAAIARWTGASPKLVRDARRIALGGAVISPALLISDLGRPERFLAMLRVFKPQSPMSVGVYVLMAFSGGVTTASAGEWMLERDLLPAVAPLLLGAGELGALLFGLPLASYTGVLIGATVIPAWNKNVATLPAHFAASGMNTAVGLLELAGHRSPALQSLGFAAALTETGMGIHLESNPDPAVEPLKHGPSGLLIRLGGVLSGPVPLVLRTLSLFAKPRRASRLRRYAAISSIVGAAVTRAAWIHAGGVSARRSRPE